MNYNSFLHEVKRSEIRTTYLKLSDDNILY